MPKKINIFIQILSDVVNKKVIDWNLFENFLSEDWEQLYELSKKQGVVAIVFESLKEIPKEFAPSQNIYIKWLSHSLLIEKQMRKREIVAKEFAEKFSERDIQVVVLKGLAYASYFPNPYHRESGDLDCYLMGKKEDGDKLVLELGGKMKEAGNMHSHLYYKGLTIENHSLLTNSDKSYSSIKTENLFQNLIKKGNNPIGVTKLLKPNADFTAMFLIKHAQRHFIKEGIWMRHFLDWAFFLRSESSNVNWGKVIPMMEECKMLNFAKVLTSICIDKLGISVDVDELKDFSKMSSEVLMDIFEDRPQMQNETFIQKCKRISHRFYRMWKFRSLAYKSYKGMVWETFAVSTYMQKIKFYLL